MKTYVAELRSEKYGYTEIQFKAHDLKDADKYASQKVKMMRRNDPSFRVSNVIEVKNA